MFLMIFCFLLNFDKAAISIIHFFLNIEGSSVYPERFKSPDKQMHQNWMPAVNLRKCSATKCPGT